AVIDGCVVFDDARIEAGARLHASVIGRAARIDEGVVLDGVVIGDAAVIGAGNELLTGVRVWPETVISRGTVRFSSDE
ncbi:MAG TPA: NDP-sugar synthase, partial [Acidothermaceae bacterium]|nr:NDP-sugar synthase [Acidothermaceae bacterium]